MWRPHRQNDRLPPQGPTASVEEHGAVGLHVASAQSADLRRPLFRQEEQSVTLLRSSSDASNVVAGSAPAQDAAATATESAPV
jgi:hypothetical protein